MATIRSIPMTAVGDEEGVYVGDLPLLENLQGRTLHIQRKSGIQYDDLCDPVSWCGVRPIMKLEHADYIGERPRPICRKCRKAKAAIVLPDFIREVLTLFADERNWTQKQTGAIRFTGGHSIPDRIGQEADTQTSDWTTRPFAAAKQAIEKMDAKQRAEGEGK